MEYLLKSGGLLAIVYLFYMIFLQKETFYKTNRMYFLLGIVTAFLLPLIIIYKYIEMPSNIIGDVASNDIQGMPIPKLITEVQQSSFDWFQLVWIGYVAGVVFLLFKMVIELFSLKKLINSGDKIQTKYYTLVHVQKEIMPFSFFKWIVYNKNSFSSDDFNKILAHEKVHVKHWHSIDMLMMRIVSIIQWFNPFVWLYKQVMEQNLEFIADNAAQDEVSSLKEYQYLLLKTSVDHSLFALTNNYFNSNLKTRIMMLQKSKSRKINQLRYLILLPIVFFFIYSFNIEEVYKLSDNQQINIGTPNFVMPVAKKDLTRMNGYGMRVNPFTKKRAMHNGLDYSAKKGANVFASASGTILAVGENDTDGKYIKISHADNYQTNYFHLNSIDISKNANVVQGEIIGTVGNTGASKGAHLHFEILKDDNYINPIKLINSYENTNSGKHITYMFDRSSSNNFLDELARTLEKESGVMFEIEAKRKNGNIISYTFRTKYPNVKESTYIHATKNDNGIDKTYVKVIEDQKFVVWTKLSKIIISKEEVISTITKKKKSDPKPIKKALYVINGKKYNGSDIDASMTSTEDVNSISVYKGAKAVKKYGEKAKGGVIVMYKDGTGFIKYKGKRYVYNITDNKVTFYNKFGDVIKRELAEKLRLKLIDDDIANKRVTLKDTSVKGENYVKYKGEMYYFVEAKKDMVFYNRFGEKVGVKLSKELKKILDKK